jgi:predicted nucleotidyltransferase
MDIYGFAIPAREEIFPHLSGYIQGFGPSPKIFQQWQKHGIEDKSALAGKGRVYDFTIFNIVKYFNLLMDNNPNIIDSLFTPLECVIHSTHVANMVREKRNIFLHKGCFAKFKGYAFSQLHKMTTKNPIGKRKQIREQLGFDVKFAYHLVRLLNECEQILMNETLDLRLNNEHLKAIRRGEVPEEDIRAWASNKEMQLETLFVNSKLPNNPRYDEIRQLLLDCLEHHYGSLEKCIETPDKYKVLLQQMKDMIDKSGL